MTVKVLSPNLWNSREVLHWNGCICKESACNVEDPGSIPGSGRSPGEEDSNPLQYSGLENSMNRGAWQAPVHGVSKSQTWLSDLHFHFSLSYCSLRIYRNSLNKTPSFWLTEKGNERKLTWWGANWELTIRKALSEEMIFKVNHEKWEYFNVKSWGSCCKKGISCSKTGESFHDQGSARPLWLDYREGVGEEHKVRF